MAGRYGGDQLNIALIVLYLILAVIAQITQLWIIWILEILLLAFCIFRILSRNVERRYRENLQFLKLWNPVKGWFQTRTIRAKDKTHRYYHWPEMQEYTSGSQGKRKDLHYLPGLQDRVYQKDLNRVFLFVKG